MQTRVRRKNGTLETLHTLNGTATAMGRTMIAIIENHQEADGSVVIPEHLWRYLPERAQVLRPAKARV
jgi:seryl-tRNA synthetase